MRYIRCELERVVVEPARAFAPRWCLWAMGTIACSAKRTSCATRANQSRMKCGWLTSTAART